MKISRDWDYDTVTRDLLDVIADNLLLDQTLGAGFAGYRVHVNQDDPPTIEVRCAGRRFQLDLVEVR